MNVRVYLSVCIDDKLDRGAPPCVFDRQEKERLEKEQEIEDCFFPSRSSLSSLAAILPGAEYVVFLFRAVLRSPSARSISISVVRYSAADGDGGDDDDDLWSKVLWAHSLSSS